MGVLMKICFWRVLPLVMTGLMLAGCGSRVAKDALEKSAADVQQKDYASANNALVDGLKARENEITGPGEPSTDPAVRDALTKKVEADPDILKLERAQIPVYLRMEKARPSPPSSIRTSSRAAPMMPSFTISSAIPTPSSAPAPSAS